MTDVNLFAFQSFSRLLIRLLIDKGVIGNGEAVHLLDAWFGEVMALGQTLQEVGVDQDVDDVLQAIHAMTAEFTPR